MADSVSTEAWLDQRRWAALEEALKAQGSNVKRHLQDYLITLYNETVPLERWVQIETAITKEELESAQAAEDQKVYAAFHIRENGHDSIFSTGNGEEFLDVAIRLRRYLQGGAESVKGDFSHHFYKAQPITRERFDELATLRMENIGKVSGAFEIDMDAAWISSLLIMDGWHTFKIKDVSAAVYHATRSLHVPLEYQWHKFINHLDGKQIEPESFASAEIGGLRPLEKGDILCIDGPFPTDRELKFRLDLSSYGVQKEVLNLMTDCSKPENSLEITCSYDAARQGISNKLDLTLRQKNGMVRHDFFYPLMEEERAHLLKIVEQFCQQQAGKTLNDYYAQLDMERENPPELTAGVKRLPIDTVSFNDDWLNVYANFDWKTGRIDSALTVCLVCSDGHEFEFSYPLTPAEQVQLWDQMDAYCRQQSGQTLGETRTSLLREQAEEGLEIRL